MHSRARLMKEEVASKYLSPIMMQKILVGENSYYLFSHRRRTGEGYFANSLRPMSYLVVIWELYVLCLKTKVFFVELDTQNHGKGTHSAKMGAVV